jgi:photosystem II stability/assembly factor-like uncharacterized protein
MRNPGRAFTLTLAILGIRTGVAVDARWNEIDSGLPDTVAGVRNLVIDRTGSTLYTVGSGIFKSMDSGATWKALSNMTGVSVLALDPTLASTVYAGTSRGLFKSTDGGGSWASAGLAESYIATLVVDPVTPSTLYAAGGVDDHISKSTDGGGKLDGAQPGPSHGRSHRTSLDRS